MLLRLVTTGAAPRWSVAPPTIVPGIGAAPAPALHAALKTLFDPEQRLPIPDALVGEAGA